MIEVLQNIKFIFFVSVFFLMFLLEYYFPKRKWETHRMKRLGFHIVLSIFNTVVMYIPRIFLIIPALMIVNENNLGLLNTIDQSFLVEALIALLILDFAYYWWHRLSHTIPFLWRFHAVHHGDTHVDVNTSLRFHFGELVLSAVYRMILVFLIGVPISVFIFYEILLSSASHFHHSNINLPDKIDDKLSKFIVSPKYHTTHHTVKKTSRDANYCSFFTIWDRIFFTYQESNDSDRLYLGLQDRSLELKMAENIAMPFKKTGVS